MEVLNKHGDLDGLVRREGLILQGSGLDFESEGVLNPAVIDHQGKIHMFYRAVSQGNRSVIGYARLGSPLEVEYRSERPLLVPEADYESQGVEDPRIVMIDDEFYLTYTAYDGQHALGALATSSDLVRFERRGLIAPKISNKEFARALRESGGAHVKYFRLDQCSPLMWDKNLMFFPTKIRGKYAFLHRLRPGIQLVLCESPYNLDREFWSRYFADFSSHIVLDPRYPHEMSYIGGGCPPIETADGWLLIYHSVYDTMEGYVYSACAALLDLDDPTREISRLPSPLFSPVEDYEKKGEVNNVCFPTGALVQDGRLYIYYGAADDKIACASMELHDLLQQLKATRI